MKRKINYFILISLIIYILLSIHALAIIYTWISERNYNEMGKSAMNLAIIISNSVEIKNGGIDCESLLNGLEDSKEIKKIYLLKREECTEEKAGYFESSKDTCNQISGMAPMYTKDGNYVGMIRVDMYTESLHIYKKNVLAFLSMLLLIPTIVLISLFINYHNRYKKEMKTTLYKDKLTGLYNRYYYESYISKIVRKLRKTNGNLSVIMLDIDDFKMYNDYYGHVNGDDVLKVVAKEFSEEIEKFRGCSGRYGGEEMIGILPNITFSEGEIICDRICNKIKEYRILHENKECEKILTVSIGIATGSVVDAEWGIKDLIKKADAALYNAKKAGKNCYKREID